MFKRLLKIIGIILLIIVCIVGVRTFIQRHRNKELIPAAPKTQTLVKDTPTNTIVPTAQPVTFPSFDKNEFSTTEPASLWIVANKKRPLSPLQYAPTDLVWVGNNQQMRTQAGDAFSALVATAKAEGLDIQALSGYRSYNTQVTVYNNEVKNNGQAAADTQSARPGYSEHQTGLAVDVGGGGCGIENCFGDTAEGKWVAAHAYEYGFIVRYTAEKQDITGYRAEPWHLRFVGTKLTYELRKQNIATLEEFFNL
jgi:zinc D-Ala-D-Ala carboxypeptidase